jgi:hypothetical protein
LGDKLQRLAHVSPRHVGLVELLVDQILRNLNGALCWLVLLWGLALLELVG